MNLKIHRGMLKKLQKIAQIKGKNVETIINEALREFIMLEKSCEGAINHVEVI